MRLLDATVNTDRESINVPPEWNLPKIKMLYDRDFYDDGDDTSQPPSKQRVKQLAQATTQYERVCINVGEGWRLYLPGSWGYDNQSVPGDVSNQQAADKVKEVLIEWRKWNDDSLLGWWGLPHQASIYNISQVPAAQNNDYGWRGPIVEAAPYSGIVEMECWFGGQVSQYLDWTGPNAYYNRDTPDQPDKTYEQFWMEQVAQYKAVSDIGYGLPCWPFIVPRYASSPLLYLADDLHRRLLERFGQVLYYGDAVCWWEANQAAPLNAQLAVRDDSNRWINMYEELAL